MIWSKFHYFYANFKRARASSYFFQKEYLKSLFNKDISILYFHLDKFILVFKQ